jgi:hypothetical protein
MGEKRDRPRERAAENLVGPAGELSRAQYTPAGAQVKSQSNGRGGKPAGNGWTKVSWALRDKLPQMSGTETKVYVALVCNADIVTREAHPPMPTLVAQTRYHRVTVWRALLELAKLELIRPAGDGWLLLDVAPTQLTVAPTQRETPSALRPRNPLEDSFKSLETKEPSPLPPSTSRKGANGHSSNGRKKRYRRDPEYSAAEDVAEFKRERGLR